MVDNYRNWLWNYRHLCRIGQWTLPRSRSCGEASSWVWRSVIILFCMTTWSYSVSGLLCRALTKDIWQGKRLYCVNICWGQWPIVPEEWQKGICVRSTGLLCGHNGDICLIKRVYCDRPKNSTHQKRHNNVRSTSLLCGHIEPYVRHMAGQSTGRILGCHLLTPVRVNGFSIMCENFFYTVLLQGRLAKCQNCEERYSYSHFHNVDSNVGIWRTNS